ncbi:MAG: MATE family efflux transporter [Lachnospiraceae bacterium]|nr:MATE family efflux transporter [Lachnospiraceae bacterium]MCM1302963.1 MATE family efflux transporter [Butyrivibrio sp.]MCM1343035.1 MATE family efflux transporter [Muribaculaceae bacterium]MCM1215616.1 MATE family efflux transporter [Lachnospiraceae bacterium]MCM1238513.1 MATE family efflux transporter [Lachnospiraceae bacterium]
MTQDLTKGPVMRSMLRFAVPMILGNLLQQCYNIADTLIVGKFLGANALAAVGSSFTLMTFLTSILLGLCMGSGTVFSICFGRQDEKGLKESIYASFALIAGLTLLLNILAFACLDQIRYFLRVPTEVWGGMREYLAIIFCGITASFLYNYFASFLRSVGNSVVPLVFLAVSAGLNILLDLWFVLGLKRGIAGAAEATVTAQYISGLGITAYALLGCPQLKPDGTCRIRWTCIKEIAGFSVLTCIQQSIMNLGILMVQGLVNSFGPTIMAAFAAAVKIDAFAYMPVQDFGNAFSTFIAQNHGAKKEYRIRDGLRGAVLLSAAFCAVVSVLVWIFARPLMELFVEAGETAVVAEGIRYLHIEGAFYCGIGCLFLLYGLYRALGRPGMSVVLTVISLGTRVALAYTLSAVPAFGVAGIWWSVPIGWFLADMAGLAYYIFRKNRLLIFT